MIVGQGLKTYFFFSASLWFIYLFFSAITDFSSALFYFNDDNYEDFITNCLLILYAQICIKMINKSSNIYSKNGRFFIKNIDDFRSSKSLKIALFYIFNLILISCLAVFIINLFVVLFNDDFFYFDSDKYSAAICFILFSIFLNYLIFFNYAYFKYIKVWNCLKKINFYSTLMIICSQIIATLQVFYFSNSIAQNNQKFYIFLIQTSLILAVILALLFISWKKASQNSEKTNKTLNPQNDIFLQKTLNLTDEVNELLKDISILNKHSKLYIESFRVKKALLFLSKSIAEDKILDDNKIYLQILKRRINELEGLFFNKNFEIQNHILKDEVRFGKFSTRYSV